MANQKKGFVMYFDSLGLLRLFPPNQIGELLLALYDYAQRICDTEETPEEALFRYTLLEETTQVGFISMAGHILRDTRVWKQRQAQCRSSAAQRVQRQQAAMKLLPEKETTPRKASLVGRDYYVPDPNWKGMVEEKEVVEYLKEKEMARWVEQLKKIQDEYPPTEEDAEGPPAANPPAEEPEPDPAVSRAYIDRIRKNLSEINRTMDGRSAEAPMEETPIETVFP